MRTCKWNILPGRYSEGLCQIIAEPEPECSISSASRPCGKNWRPAHRAGLGATVGHGAKHTSFLPNLQDLVKYHDQRGTLHTKTLTAKHVHTSAYRPFTKIIFSARYSPTISHIEKTKTKTTGERKFTRKMSSCILHLPFVLFSPIVVKICRIVEYLFCSITIIPLKMDARWKHVKVFNLLTPSGNFTYHQP
jgi:hypothetical protein